MQFSADGRRLITGGDDGIGRISDSTSGQLIAELKHPTPGQIDRVCLNHDGTRAVTATASSVVLWKLGDDHPIPLPSKVGVEVFPGVNFTPNGLLVVTARDGELNAWDVATGKRVWGPVTFAPATDVRLSPDGRRFAAFGQGEVVGLFETTTGKLEHSLTHRGVAVDAIFSADGELVATCSFLMKTSGYAQVWESATGAAITQPLEGEEELHQVRLSPDSTLVCATERSGRVRVWSIATGRECVDPLPHDAAAFPAWFVDAGQKVLTVANGSVQFHELWELGEMAPPWLPDLAEAVGGLGVSDKGVAVPLQNRIHLLSSLREKINANADSDSFSKWARWFFADRKHRSGSPFSAQTTSAALTSR